MPRRSDVAAPAAQTVNVSVDVPQNKPAAASEPEEKSPMWFWDMLAAIPRDQWGNVYSVMAWREEPKVPGVPGAKGFLFEAFEPITLSYFKERYGGGKFKAVLQKNSKFKTTHIFDVEGQPKYDLSREMPHPHSAAPVNGDANSALLKDFVGVLRDELARSRESNNVPNPATDEAISLLSKASEKAMDIVANRANAGGTGNSTAQLAELVTIVKGLMPAQSNDGGLLGLLAPVLKPLIEKLLTPSDPLAELAKLKSVMELFDGMRGGSDGKPKDWRAMLAEGAVAKAPEILKEVREIVQENRETARERRGAAEAIREVEQLRRGQAVTPPVQPGAPAATTETVMPSGPLRTVPIDRSAPTSPAPAAAPGSPVIAGAESQMPSAASGMSSTETDAVANFMMKRIVEMVNDERDAEDVVDFIEEIDPSMNDLLVQFSPEMVTTFLAGRPVIGEATKHPKWNAFLVRAQGYIKEIRAEDDAIRQAEARVPA